MGAGGAGMVAEAGGGAGGPGGGLSVRWECCAAPGRVTACRARGGRARTCHAAGALEGLGGEAVVVEGEGRGMDVLLLMVVVL